MSKELEERLIISLDKIGGWVENIESFTLEQAPLVIQEMITFHYNLYMIGFIVSLFFSILGLATIPYVAKNINAEDSDGNIGKMVLALVTMTFGIIISIPLTIVNGYNLLYMTMAPRLYVLEQIKNLL